MFFESADLLLLRTVKIFTKAMMATTLAMSMALAPMMSTMVATIARIVMQLMLMGKLMKTTTVEMRSIKIWIILRLKPSLHKVSAYFFSILKLSYSFQSLK
jgi:hypothetical protein